MGKTPLARLMQQMGIFELSANKLENSQDQVTKGNFMVLDCENLKLYLRIMYFLLPFGLLVAW